VEAKVVAVEALEVVTLSVEHSLLKAVEVEQAPIIILLLHKVL
jgi:hypothetical protein